ncbi:MAG: site-2 protease family protein, partial [Candidatus Omnitrophica bacterium]|nr:site-2 protease family protein [Candidatus Omnitrophota bacterium]
MDKNVNITSFTLNGGIVTDEGRYVPPPAIENISSNQKQWNPYIPPSYMGSYRFMDDSRETVFSAQKFIEQSSDVAVPETPVHKEIPMSFPIVPAAPQIPDISKIDQIAVITTGVAWVLYKKIFANTLPIKIHWSAPLLLLMLYFSFASQYTFGGYYTVFFSVAVLANVLLHELGHASVMKAFGLRVKSIKFFALGAVVDSDDLEKIPGLQFTIITLAGVTVNILTAVLLYAAIPLFVVHDLPVVELANLLMLLAVFNLVPVFPLDGGQSIRGLLQHFYGEKQSFSMMYKVNIMMTIVCIGLAFTAELTAYSGYLIMAGMLGMIGTFMLSNAVEKANNAPQDNNKNDGGNAVKENEGRRTKDGNSKGQEISLSADDVVAGTKSYELRAKSNRDGGWITIDSKGVRALRKGSILKITPRDMQGHALFIKELYAEIFNKTLMVVGFESDSGYLLVSSYGVKRLIDMSIIGDSVSVEMETPAGVLEDTTYGLGPDQAQDVLKTLDRMIAANYFRFSADMRDDFISALAEILILLEQDLNLKGILPRADILDFKTRVLLITLGFLMPETRIKITQTMKTFRPPSIPARKIYITPDVFEPFDSFIAMKEAIETLSLKEPDAIRKEIYRNPSEYLTAILLKLVLNSLISMAETKGLITGMEWSSGGQIFDGGNRKQSLPAEDETGSPRKNYEGIPFAEGVADVSWPRAPPANAPHYGLWNRIIFGSCYRVLTYIMFLHPLFIYFLAINIVSKSVRMITRRNNASGLETIRFNPESHNAVLMTPSQAADIVAFLSDSGNPLLKNSVQDIIRYISQSGFTVYLMNDIAGRSDISLSNMLRTFNAFTGLKAYYTDNGLIITINSEINDSLKAMLLLNAVKLAYKHECVETFHFNFPEQSIKAQWFALRELVSHPKLFVNFTVLDWLALFKNRLFIPVSAVAINDVTGSQRNEIINPLSLSGQLKILLYQKMRPGLIRQEGIFDAMNSGDGKSNGTSSVMMRIIPLVKALIIAVRPVILYMPFIVLIPAIYIPLAEVILNIPQINLFIDLTGLKMFLAHILLWVDSLNVVLPVINLPAFDVFFTVSLPVINALKYISFNIIMPLYVIMGAALGFLVYKAADMFFRNYAHEKAYKKFKITAFVYTTAVITVFWGFSILVPFTVGEYYGDLLPVFHTLHL